MSYIINFVCCLIWLAIVWGIRGLSQVPYAFVGWVIGFLIAEAIEHLMQKMRRRAAIRAEIDETRSSTRARIL